MEPVQSRGHQRSLRRPGRPGRSVVALVLFAASFAGTWSPWANATATAATQSLYHPATKTRPGPRPAVTTGPDDLQLLSQTPWLRPSSGQFQLHLKVTAADPAAEMLEVNVYSELTTRSQFQTTLGGEFYGLYYEAGGGPSRSPISRKIPPGASTSTFR